MRIRSWMVLAFSFAVCARASLAEDKQQDGLKLVSRAIELADIRAAGSHPFRMKAIFWKMGDTAAVGTYMETWVQQEQWRREIQLGDIQRLEVGSGENKWVVEHDNSPRREDSIPPQALDLRTWAPSGGAKVKKIVDENQRGIQERCIQLETAFTFEVFCIKANDGTLVSHEWQSRTMQSRFLYSYNDYQKFGARVFPRSLQYQHDGQQPISIRITELSQQTSSDSALFVAPPGALQLANCLTTAMVPPSADFAPDAVFPPGEHSKQGFVVLSLIVGADGVPGHIQVAKSGGAAFDAAALQGIQRWRFKPAQCHDKAAAAQINVQVTFKR